MLRREQRTGTTPALVTYAPTACSAWARTARILPFSSSAISAVMSWSRRGVREGRLARDEHGGHDIDVRDVAQGAEDRHHARVGDVRAHRVQRLGPHRENPAILVERHLRRDELVAAVVVAGQRFGARGAPFPRTAEPALDENGRILA